MFKYVESILNRPFTIFMLKYIHLSPLQVIYKCYASSGEAEREREREREREKQITLRNFLT
jgi:hypothetical protein